MLQNHTKTVPEILKSSFSSLVRSRGESYYRRGAVQSIDGDYCEVRAQVRGARTYRVKLVYEYLDHALQMKCSCPYSDHFDGYCKHLWAVILAADERGFLEEMCEAEHSSDVVDDIETFLDDDVGDDDDDDFLDVEREYEETPVKHTPRYELPAKKKSMTKQGTSPRPKPPPWKTFLQQQKKKPADSNIYALRSEFHGKRIVYFIELGKTIKEDRLDVTVATQTRKMNGEWGKPVPRQIRSGERFRLPDPRDREIVSCLMGVSRQDYNWSRYYEPCLSSTVECPPFFWNILIPLLAKTGRFYLRTDYRSETMTPYRWEEAPPWEFQIVIEKNKGKKTYRVHGNLVRGDRQMPLETLELLLSSGTIFCNGIVGRLTDGGAFHWINFLRKNRELEIPGTHIHDLMHAIYSLPSLPALDIPADLEYDKQEVSPQAVLKLKKPGAYNYDNRINAELFFRYNDTVVPCDDVSSHIVLKEKKLIIPRNAGFERSSMVRLEELGFLTSNSDGTGFIVYPKKIPGVIRTLLGEGWRVEADKKVYRLPGQFHIEVTTGIDWFDLHGAVDYEGVNVKIPDLIQALKKKEDTLLLGDGAIGFIPDDLVRRLGGIIELGTVSDDHIRFKKNQAGLLDALLASMPDVDCDRAFSMIRDRLNRFRGVKPLSPSKRFRGKLREYQKAGVGWMRFLQEFGFGGCLADDMGLGKTVMTLAMLDIQHRRRNNQKNHVSLIVVPKSLVFNWKSEAARFTPGLKILEHTGPFRDKKNLDLSGYHVCLTTYGILRQDILMFKDIPFDYVVLDESTAIKNPHTQQSKSARLLTAENRLALSGTPIENHLGELWSLFEFLNPGMLGPSSVFSTCQLSSQDPDEDTRELLSRAFRPFILRRTKDVVARDLPPKVEQTIYCDMEPAQRKLYSELKEHYRASVMKRVEEQGLGRSKMHVLEALLRLRQAACHPGMINPSLARNLYSKLEILLPRIKDIISEGHKALVFSQFTKFLAILKPLLDRERITYEYLDGSTLKRGEAVAHFQTDPECRLFLISMKAGGHGLNLTAADYVFLLDPWWNPAIEMQAIDRTHRIGQKKKVFAFRLIVKDTVEEKIVQLQRSKLDLADSIITRQNSLIKKLTHEDLALLLS